MRFLNHKFQLTMLQKIFTRALCCTGTVIPSANKRIARRTEQSSNGTCLVIMVDCQRSTVGVGFLTDGASALLRGLHPLKFRNSNSVFPFQSCIASDSLHCGCLTVHFSRLQEDRFFFCIPFAVTVLLLPVCVLSRFIFSAFTLVMNGLVFRLLTIPFVASATFWRVIPGAILAVDTIFAPRRSSQWAILPRMEIVKGLWLSALGTDRLLYDGTDHGVHVSLTRFVDFVVRLVGLPPFGPFSLATLS